MLPPILDIYVVWHPGDTEGQRIAGWVIDHFHGTPYVGLIGGAVEVYTRSAPWLEDSDSPRPIPTQEPLPYGLPSSRVTAVVPVIGTCLARAIKEALSDWRSYTTSILSLAQQDNQVGIFPIRLLDGASSTLQTPLDRIQSMDLNSAYDSRILCRELSQQITQLIWGNMSNPSDNRVTVFISHTKRHSSDEESDHVDIIDKVRSKIAKTHLGSYFNFLDGIRLGLSVSDSADLARLGLVPRHAELAIGEIARSVLIGGGSLIYGGRIQPSGFTQFLIHEVHRYGRDPQSLTLCLAAPEHRKLSRDELFEFDYHTLGDRGNIIYLDENGVEIKNFFLSKTIEPDPITDKRIESKSYSSLRSFLAKITDARVILGGQLTSYKGTIPGVLEEAMISIQAGQPLYVSAGFGGAAAIVAQALNIDDLSWAPDGFPTQPKDEQLDKSIRQLQLLVSSKKWSVDCYGLDHKQQRQLSASHRPREIASLLVKGLSSLNKLP